MPPHSRLSPMSPMSPMSTAFSICLNSASSSFWSLLILTFTSHSSVDDHAFRSAPCWVTWLAFKQILVKSRLVLSQYTPEWLTVVGHQIALQPWTSGQNPYCASAWLFFLKVMASLYIPSKRINCELKVNHLVTPILSTCVGDNSHGLHFSVLSHLLQTNPHC